MVIPRPSVSHPRLCQSRSEKGKCGWNEGEPFYFHKKDNFDFLYGRQNTLGLAYKEEFNTKKYARSSRLLTVTELFNILVYEDNIR